MAPSHSLLGLNCVCVAVLLVLISVAAGSHSAHAQAVHGGEPTRKVIEHVYLWQAKADLDEAAENEFLYSMWNLQNTVTNVEFLSWTVGKIINETPQNVRYAMLGRFPSVDHLNKYMGNQVVWAWAGQHLSPVAGQEFGIDFEAEVPDTFESLHKIGEGFENAVKYVLLLTAQGGSSPAAALHSLTSSSPSSVVDVTAGPAVVPSSAGLSHGVVADLKSVESVEEFRAQPAFQELLSLSSQFVEGIFYPFQAPALERVLGASENLRHKSSLHISTI